MSTEKTTYVIETKYTLDDRAGRGLRNIGDEAERAGKHVEGVHASLGHLGAFLSAGFALHEGKKAFIDFNSELEQMKISLAAILEMNLGGTFKANQRVSEELFTEFQRFSKLTPVTTKEVMEFGTGVSAAVFGAGGKMKDFIKITEQGVIASKVFGANSAYASLEITELLMGNVNKRMRFAMQILRAAGIDEKTFKAMSGEKRMATVEKVLDSPAMREASKAFSESFAGVTSTLKDNIEIALGKVGLPLFKAVTKEVQSWNKWIETHASQIEEFSRKFASGLVDGFRTLRDIGGFLVQHADLLISIGKIWLGAKTAGAVGGIAGSLFKTVESGMKGFTSNVVGAASALTALIVAAQELGGALGTAEGKRQDRTQNRLLLNQVAGQAAAGGLDDHATAKRLLMLARSTGALSGDGAGMKLDEQRLRGALGGDVLEAYAKVGFGSMSKDASVELKKLDRSITQLRLTIASESGLALGAQRDYLLPKFLDLLGKYAEQDQGMKPNIHSGDQNITIQHMEVQAENPDEFLIDFEEFGQKMRRSPAAAREQLHGFGR